MWRLLSNALPVRTNLFRRGMKVDVLCPRCKRCPEDIPHVFWFCPKARKVWKITDLWPLLNAFLGGSFVDLFQWVGDKGKVDYYVNFVLICWSIWEARNIEIFQGQVQSREDIIARAARVRNSYHFSLHDIDYSGVHPTAITPWQPPPPGVIKINVDAAVMDSKDFFGVGLVGRDSSGLIIFAEGKCFPGRFTPHMAELVAIKEGVFKAFERGWPKWIVESDAYNAIQALSTISPFSMDELIVEQVRGLCSVAPGAGFNHCRRSANLVAHELARVSLLSSSSILYLDAIPLFLNKVVRHDLLFRVLHWCLFQTAIDNLLD